MNFSDKFGSDSTIWYPASGFRESYSDGGLYGAGDGDNYWSASPHPYNAYYMRFFSNGLVYPSTYSYRAHGFSVRCLQE